MGATTLHLVRHAAHGLLGRVLAGRMPGVALTAEGTAQADALADALAGRPIRAVLSSPVQRAQATAAPIAARHGLPFAALRAVCDPAGRVIGVGNLMVCDASVMPTIPCANLNVPVIMIAERMAALLRQA